MVGRCRRLPSVSFETLLPRVSLRQLPITRSIGSSWLIDNPMLKERRIWRGTNFVVVVGANCSWPRRGRRRRRQRCRSLLSLSCEATSFPRHTFIGNVIVIDNMRWTNRILPCVLVVVVVVVHVVCVRDVGVCTALGNVQLASVGGTNCK